MGVMRRLPVLVVLAGLVGLIVLGLAQASPSRRADENPSVPATCTISSTWKVLGNCGTVAGTNFLGTKDAQPLVIKTNKVERMRIDPGGKVGSAPRRQRTTWSWISVLRHPPMLASRSRGTRRAAETWA